MSKPFDVLERAAFARIDFQCDRVSVKGGARNHVHEYPHTPGGRPEKLGRKLYTVSMEGVFTVDNPLYPGAWPYNIKALRTLFEQETTDDLVIPTVGVIRAYATDWDQEQTTKMFNGERMKVTFLEDQEVDQLAESALAFSYTNLGQASDTLILKANLAGFKPDFFASIAALANQVQGLVDQVELQADVLSSKIGQLTAACQTFDSIVSKLNDPPSFGVVEALQDLGVAAANLSRNVLSKSSPITLFTTPALMTVTQVASAIYGDTSRAVEIMKLNPFDDALRIPQGFSVRAYPKAA